MNAIAFTDDRFGLTVLPEGDSFRVLAPALARALGFRDAFRMLESIPDAEKGYTTACTPGGEQRVGYVTEAGFYRAMGQRQAARIADPDSRAMVEAFQSWVYADMIPAIRKHGGYLTPEATEAALTDPDFIIRLATQLKEERAKRAEVEAQAAEQHAQLMIAEPKASAFDRWMGSGVEYSVDVAAKALSAVGHLTGRNRLFAELAEMGWAYRAADGWHPYQQHGPEGAKRLAVRVFYFDHPDTGKATGKTTLKVTAKGIADLAVHFGVMPAAVAEALAGAA